MQEKKFSANKKDEGLKNFLRPVRFENLCSSQSFRLKPPFRRLVVVLKNFFEEIGEVPSLTVASLLSFPKSLTKFFFKEILENY